MRNVLFEEFRQTLVCTGKHPRVLYLGSSYQWLASFTYQWPCIPEQISSNPDTGEFLPGRVNVFKNTGHSATTNLAKCQKVLFFKHNISIFNISILRLIKLSTGHLRMDRGTQLVRGPQDAGQRILWTYVRTLPHQNNPDAGWHQSLSKTESCCSPQGRECEWIMETCPLYPLIVPLAVRTIAVSGWLTWAKRTTVPT